MSEKDREIAALLQYLSAEQLQAFFDFLCLLVDMNQRAAAVSEPVERRWSCEGI